MPFTIHNEEELPSSQESTACSSQERSHGQGQNQGQTNSRDSAGPSHSYFGTEQLRRMELGQELPAEHSSENPSLNHYLQDPKQAVNLPMQLEKKENTQVEEMIDSYLYSRKQEKVHDKSADALTSSQSTDMKSDNQDSSLPSSQDISQCTSSQEPQSSLDLTAESLGPVTTTSGGSDQMSSQNSEIMLRRTDTNDTLPSADINLVSFDDFLNEEHHLNSIRGSKPQLSRADAITSPKPSTSSKRPQSADEGSPIKKLKVTHVTQSPRKDASATCQLCCSGPKDAVLVHGKSGHQMCCYRCAKRLRRHGKPCPICRRRIQRVIRNFVV